MRIFIAPDTTKYPDNLKATVVPELEQATGADLLLSIEKIPLIPGNDSLLRKHCESGLLLQVKNGNDVQESITNERLFEQCRKMLGYSQNSWVLTVGTFFDVNGKAAVGELKSRKMFGGGFGSAQVSGRLSLGYMSLKSGLNVARYAGCYVDDLVSSDYLIAWLEFHERILKGKKANEVKELSPRGIQREIVGPGHIAWLSAMFDGVGKKTAEKVWDRASELTKGQPTLSHAIGYLLTYQAAEIPGITAPMVESWRNLWGLTTNTIPPTYQALAYEWRGVDTDKVVSLSSMFRSDATTKFTADALQGLIGLNARVITDNSDLVQGKLVSVVLRDGRDAVLWVEVNKLEEKAVLLQSIVDIQLEGVDYE